MLVLNFLKKFASRAKLPPKSIETSCAVGNKALAAKESNPPENPKIIFEFSSSMDVRFSDDGRELIDISHEIDVLKIVSKD